MRLELFLDPWLIFPRKMRPQLNKVSAVAGPTFRGKTMHDVFSWFETGAATHVGKVRQLNEDNLLVRPKVGLWAVADGMGGHEAGDVASHTVIEALKAVEAPASAAALLADWETRIAAANGRLREIAAERRIGMIGTTLVLLLVYERHYA